MNPKIAVITANIGNFDAKQIFVKQDMDCDYHAYTSANLPFPLPHLNDRLKGKYIKIKPHKFLPNYDYYIWVNGNFGVVKKGFVRYLMGKLKGNDVVIARHPARKTVFEEFAYIKSEMKKGNPYLVSRYKGEPWQAEEDFYRSSVWSDWSLYEGAVVAWPNNRHLRDAFDEWWEKVIQFSNFDQSQFTYVRNYFSLKVPEITFDEMHRHLIQQGHGAAAKIPGRKTLSRFMPNLARGIIQWVNETKEGRA